MFLAGSPMTQQSNHSAREEACGELKFVADVECLQE